MRRCRKDQNQNTLAMPFLVYVLVIIVAVGSLLFGVEVITTPQPQKSAVQATVVPSKLAQREADRREEKSEGDASRLLTPIYPANPGGKTHVSVVYPTSNQSQAVANKTTGAEVAAGPQADAKAATSALTAAEAVLPQPEQMFQPTKLEQDERVNRPVQALAERSANHCEVQACASTYASFRTSDCTYQPYEAPPQQRSAQREHPLDILPSRATRLEWQIEPVAIEPATTGYAYEDKE